MVASGIIDPAKVTRSALENAASVAGMVLTTESLVADKPEPPAPAPAAPDEQAVPAVTEDSDQIYHGEDAPADAVPGGVSPVGELPQTKGEDIQPARHDLLPPGE